MEQRGGKPRPSEEVSQRRDAKHPNYGKAKHHPTFKGCLQFIDILGQFLGLGADAQEEFLEKSNACEATP
jgi:hypothetical protein